MALLSIEQDEEYKALVEKLVGFITTVDKRKNSNKKELDKQLVQVEYALQELFGKGKFKGKIP